LLCSPFDFEAVDLLRKIDIPAFKIASFEITDLELIKYTAKTGKPVIISTGMSNLGEIEVAISAVKSCRNDNIILLHCNSVYPTPVSIVNLKVINTLAKVFEVPIGFSDHTLGIHIAFAAIVSGAKIIEKHFTLDRDMQGPDHSFAIQPDELQNLVRYIRDYEAAVGNGIKKISQEEQEMIQKGRRSIIALDDIPKGSIISNDKLIIKRPGYGLNPKFVDVIIGRRAKRDIKKDDILTWDMV
jgi:N-acetylneuraminate synthase/N,N'-diacetyllegionaminate synthase